MVDAEQVLLFLGRPDDTSVEGSAEQAIPVITTMVKAYTRGNGFDVLGEPNEELEAVIVTATARLVTNPGQLAHDQAAGPFTQSLRGGFTGWTLAELAVLNRYRRRVA
ncbi:hypothetical protein AU197_21135 [Mycobacterium sp. IS-1590]|uniref:hypothetical protein n=1 Tax=Mycobacterium sp. IS-1590 TaxID=1772286 RepID=UPI000748A8F0|nr:hypothetical protein [Mycobacterium sp. IS-1590]KUI43911.1 hypothetical protein AU197_21135 [Mycobacterium sp. IS-1590]